jgi:uncharacterized protein YdcH (DUF465 family)
MKHVSLNFGAIRDTVYKYASKQIVTEGKTSTMFNTFLKSVKEVPALKLQNIIFKNIEDGKATKESLAERYVAQTLKLIESLTWDNLIDANRDVRISLLENCHVEGLSDEKNTLYEHIHTLIESTIRKGYTDIEKSNAAYEYVINHLLNKNAESSNINESEVEEYPTMLSWEYVTNLAVSNFNQRFSHLNESEKKIVKILLSTDEIKQNYFEDLKKESLELLDLAIEKENDSDSLKVLNGFKNNIETGLSENSIEDNIIHLCELRDTLSDPS